MARIREKVRLFYERHPYPSQKVNSREDLLHSLHSKVMEKILAAAGLSLKSLEGMRVLDAGCGTGEKAVFCSLLGAKADAFDISCTSISEARKLAAKLSAPVHFQVASFEGVRLKQEYDLILCIGSLHHTENPKKNFMKVAGFLKPGGFIVLGLYNLYGRLAFRLYRSLLWLGEKDPESIIKKTGIFKEKDRHRYSILADRLASPHETYHSVEEVLGWFSEAGILPIASEPPVRLTSKPHILFSQLCWLAKRRGFFFIGGRKQLPNPPK
ncbi:MAG: class I SAM-dependent methyltransferase [Candidatus Micrarchaeota archaeon]|nr:class I SAM-dependent methyltransferase [Candidatus Micrarchaeota archaeon]